VKLSTDTEEKDVSTNPRGARGRSVSEIWIFEKRIFQILKEVHPGGETVPGGKSPYEKDAQTMPKRNGFTEKRRFVCPFFVSFDLFKPSYVNEYAHIIFITRILARNNRYIMLIDIGLYTLFCKEYTQ